MSIIIKGVTVLTHDTLLKNVDVLIENKKIVRVGENINIAADTCLCGKNKVLMPGFVNAHTHSPMTLFRSYAEGLPLEKWLQTKIFPAEDRLCGEDVYYGAMMGILEMIASGTTAFHEMYFFMEDIAAAVLETGIRAKICRGLMSSESLGFQNDKRLLENVNVFKEYNNTGDGRLTVGFGMHSVYTCSPEYLEYCAKAAKDLGASVHVHLSETESENKNCIDAYGKTPTEVMYGAGVFDVPCVAAHCVHVSDSDLPLLKEKGVCAAFNPTSNLKLRSGVPRIREITEYGVLTALGTDGASSNNNLNMFEEMHIAALLSGISPEETIKMATVDGAYALGLSGIGDIKEGYEADLILIDIDKPHFYPVHDIRANMVFSAQGSDVSTVIVGGKILYSNGEFTTADFEKIKYHCEKSIKRVCYQ